MSHRDRSLPCLLPLVPLVLAPLGCRAPTEVTVEISTDVACSEVSETGVVVAVLGELDDLLVPLSASTASCDPTTGRIGSVVLVPGGDKSSTLAFKVITALDPALTDACRGATIDASCIVARRVLSYVPHTPLTVPVVMRRACAGVMCTADQTCVNGQCTSASLDPSTCADPAGCGEQNLPHPQPAAWAVSATMTSGDGAGRDVALDSHGNAWMAADFNGSLELCGQSYTSNGRDVLVASFDPAGRCRWSYVLQAGGEQFATRIAIGPDDSVYVAGTYAVQDLTLGSFAGPASVGVANAFVGKLATGEVPDWQWAEFFVAGNVGGNGSIGVGGLVADAEGVYVATNFAGTMDLRPAVANPGLSTTLVAGNLNGGGNTALVAFSAANGRPAWIWFEPSVSAHAALAATLGAAGELYVTGSYAGAFPFVGAPPVPQNQGAQGFVVSRRTTGAALATPFGIFGSGPALPMGIGTDGSGQVCVAGDFGNPLVPDILHVGPQTLNGPGGLDIFVGCLSPDGAATGWASELGDNANQQLAAMRGDGAGALYLAGLLHGGLSHGPMELTSGIGSPFVAMLAPAAEQASWGRVLVPTGQSDQLQDLVSAVAGRGTDALVVTGQQQSAMVLGPSTTLPTSVSPVPFVAQLIR